MTRTRFALAAALSLIAVIVPAERAQSQFISCPGAAPGDHACGGFQVLGAGGLTGDGTFHVVADGASLYLYNPTTNFDFYGALFQSITSSPNHITARAFTRAVIDQPFSGFPWSFGGNGPLQGPYSQSAVFDIFAGAPIFKSVAWTNVAAIAFDGSGGSAPGCIGAFCSVTYWDYTVSRVDVALVTPEPTTLVLLGTGLLGVMGMTRRRIRA